MKPIKGICCLSAVLLLLAGCAAGPAADGGTEYSVVMPLLQSEEAAGVTDVLARIRPTVVDVTSRTDDGLYAGSGVIVAQTEADGERQYFIATNHHVISDGTEFSVEVLSIAADGAESTTAYDAVLIGSSFKRDIAVLSVRTPLSVSLSVAGFIEDSESVKVGTEVLAIGNPLGILGGTVTHGIVSATKRDVNVSGIGTMTLMQTDASINGGNSGGGLFDRNGALVGIINSGYDTYNGTSVEGLNFAIPANDARTAVTSLIATHAEQNGAVTQYGYVEGDARIDLNLSVSSLYASSEPTVRTVCLVAAAASEESPLYSVWGTSMKVVTAVSVNGTRTEFTGGDSSYDDTEKANRLFGSVRAGDSVTVEYRDIATRTVGNGPFSVAYSYVGAAHETTFTAEQYIYIP